MEKLFEQLHTLIKKNNYESYDPYDGASSGLDLLNRYYYTRLFLTYFNKFSPVNFRPFFKIPKSRQNQCLAFIGLSLAKYDPSGFKEEITALSEEIMKASLIDDYQYHCWEAHGFPIQMRNQYRIPGIPDVVGDEACGRLLMEYHKLTGNDLALKQSVSFSDYLIDELFTEYKDALFFRYTPETPQYQCTYNASTLAAAYILEVNKYIGSEKGNEEAFRAFDYVVTQQNPDGSWNYSINLDTGFEKKQIDFHQGFILDTLLTAMEHAPETPGYRQAYEKGLEFYFNNQFNKEGRGYYRLPKKWPANIHNQSQGIITFTKAYEAGYGKKYLDFAETVLEWTLENMQGNDGHFYYLKYPFFTNKIPYMRWSDGNMLYALSHLKETN